MSKNPHVTMARKAFKNWDQAQHHAQQLLDNGEISKTEYNQIKSQAKATTKDSDAE